MGRLFAKPKENKRSSHWPTFRRKFLKGRTCAVCGSKKELEAHHIKPFHLFPELELVESNVIPLCESTKYVNCHLMFGHYGNYRSYNRHVRKDARLWSKRIRERP